MELSYIIGTLGNLFFGFKSLPQIISSYRKKSVEGLSVWMLISDFLGNILCGYFIFSTTGFILWPQFVNYGFATLWLVILFIFKLKYK